MTSGRGARLGALAFILAIALGVRLYDIGFGLPSLYDPDEPIFMVTALKLLKQGTLNPGWFGHPGTTTIYLVAVLDVAVMVFGKATGQFTSIAGFASAAYANPALLFIPARVAMALFGVGCVWLTYALGRRLFGTATGLIAAAFLAINSLHILWSQVIRTDVMASLFMLASLIFSIRAAQGGRTKDYLISGVFVGVAIATKWPSAIVAIALAGAAFHRISNGAAPASEFRRLGAAILCIVAALFLASPYIFLDWPTVLANVGGEVNHGHLGHNGGGFVDNLRWYLVGQTAPSMGYIGLVLAIAGAAIAWWRQPIARWTVLPVLIGFLALISSQSMVWSRWLIPAMPLLCIFAALSVDALRDLVRDKWRTVATAILALSVGVPSAAAARDRIRERATDTRMLAARWASANIPAGSTVLLEHLELSLRNRPWRFLFPLGRAGCVDGLRVLVSGMKYDDLEKVRNGSPIVDIGNVDRARLGSCHADFAILTYYDLYTAEAGLYPAEMHNYATILERGRTIALFRPVPGLTGGPVVRIVAL
jgi:hypothetical protein